MDAKPLPAFYCCYLLRSKVKHTQLYVGSTPNPKRRLDQHNGIAKGGANRTGTLNGAWRPWEMSLIVTGFPSNIAALQFEWAWQNSHLTRKISKEERISIFRTELKYSKKKGKSITRPKRLPVTLKDKLTNLHLLLRVPSFTRWPLQLQFFQEDVYQSWRAWTQENLQPIRSSITIVKDFQGEWDVTYATSNRQAQIDTLDVSYTPLRNHVEKSMILKQASSLACSCCTKKVDMSVENILVCTQERCYAVSHLACLASSFLGPGSDEVVPIDGACPKCRTNLKWTDLVRELTLRTRDEQKVVRLLKPKRRKGQTDSSQALTDEEGPEDEEEDLVLEDVVDEPSMHEVKNWDSSSIGSDDEARPDILRDGGQPLYPDPKQELSVVVEDSEDSADWYMLD